MTDFTRTYEPPRRTVPVTALRMLTPSIAMMTIRDYHTARTAQPAQFINLYTPDASRLLPRPFGVAGADPTTGAVTVIFALVGAGTRELSRLQPGDTVDMLGPLGRGYTIPTSGHIMLVGGGLGIPPLIHTARLLHQREHITVTALFGYRDTPYANDLTEAHTDTLHSINDNEGNVITLLNQYEAQHSTPPDTILTCGPTPMLHAVANWANQRHIPCQVSMEQHMSCGYGACVTCTIDTVQGRRKVCTDGPAFNAHDITW